jgi:hypothetical protein
MENSPSEGTENQPVQTEPIDLSKASSENIVTFSQIPEHNASDSVGKTLDIVIPRIMPSTSGSTREVTPMWQVVKDSSALMDPKVLKTTVKKVKFAVGTKKGRRRASATVVSGDGIGNHPPPSRVSETMVPERYTSMDSAPPPIRNLANGVTLSEFNHAGWFHDRYLAGTSWIKAWAERFGLDTAIWRHPYKVEFELKNNIVIMPEFQSHEQWVIEISCENSEKVSYFLDSAGAPLEPLCVCTRYNDRKCKLAFQRLYPNKPGYQVVALQLEFHTFITARPYEDTTIGLGQGMMDLIKRRQQLHVAGTWPVANTPLSMATRKILCRGGHEGSLFMEFCWLCRGGHPDLADHVRKCECIMGHPTVGCMVDIARDAGDRFVNPGYR